MRVLTRTSWNMPMRPERTQAARPIDLAGGSTARGKLRASIGARTVTETDWDSAAAR